jgi:drug/metabolite transporter (DMT)-like permease
MPALSWPPAAIGGLASGIVWMLITAFFFVCVHATGKLLVIDYPVLQVLWARYIFHLILTVLLIGPRLLEMMRTSNLKLQLLRSSFMLLASAFYFAGVQLLPLAEANAIGFLTPILVVMLAQPVLGEKVGLRRWIGVGIGVIGALIIIRPGSGLMDIAATFLIASSLCNASYQLTTRKLGPVDTPLTTLLYTALVGTIGSSAVVPFVWQPVSVDGWLLMVTLGLVAMAGHFAIIKAYQAAPAPAIAPFSYSVLLWSVLFGYVLFGDLPDGWTLVGAAIIVMGGLYIVRMGRAKSAPLPGKPGPADGAP